MGTAISVELWSENRSAGEAAITAVMDEMHRIDREMSPHKPDSELSRISENYEWEHFSPTQAQGCIAVLPWLCAIEI